MDPVQWPEEGPEVDVWNHIHTGLDLAEEELDVLPDDLRQFTESLGRAVVDVRSHFVLESAQAGFLELDEELLALPWVRYAADLHVARDGMSRATSAIDRYLEVRPAAATRGMPVRALPYVGEAVQTFIFGFDSACVAFCRAALEQVLRDALLARRVYTEPQLKREQPTAGALLENAKRTGVLGSAYDAAKRVVDRGDTVMHSHIYDAKILKQMARDSVADLATASVAVLSAA